MTVQNVPLSLTEIAFAPGAWSELRKAPFKQQQLVDGLRSWGFGDWGCFNGDLALEFTVAEAGQRWAQFTSACPPDDMKEFVDWLTREGVKFKLLPQQVGMPHAQDYS